MKAITASPTTGDSIAAATLPAAEPPSLPSKSSHNLSSPPGIVGGSSSGAASAAAHRRASSSGGSGSGSGKTRPSSRSSRSSSSKSARPEGSRSGPPSPRVVYGRGTIERLAAELARLGASSPLIVSSPSRVALARHIQSLIPNLNSRILDSAVVNVPARVIDDAVSRIDDRDVVISVGGASAVGLAKAIGCRKRIPHVCIPTTYSGSEMMPLLLDAHPARHKNSRDVGGSGGNKSSRHHCRDYEYGSCSCRSRGSHTTSFRDPRVLPSVIIYDEDLAMSLPERISAPSGELPVADSTELLEEDETAQWSYIHLPGV
ncbi:Alcohol dehydrogenase, iron-type [Metarhizium rileyi]|uniref:Alcohol dehydrogenase, iron-type n=1 Tax=Metarhizium rileyi (strain RCEF 4871) TaxID=1649241 RepID=A0A166YE83_METRR|nr:Alcohol dehydrogenase, iron-type [Metarhizium rileyi RCEF 4871]TWU77462.1 hypothetical protein ED733_006895 [Metarhizium rileyi]